MKNYPNIETRKINGHYIGYSNDGRSWRITGQSGNWSANSNVTRQGSLSQLYGFSTLSELSAELSKIEL